MKLCLTVLVLVLSFHSGLCKYNYNHSKNGTNALKTHADTFEYFTKNKNGITIPVMIHLDKSVTNNLPKEYKTNNKIKIKNVFRNILNTVETLYRRPSLNQTVQFTLLNVKFLKNATKKFTMDENVSKYLKSYCQWQGEKKQKAGKWYYSILFTGLNVFYYGRNNAKVWSSTGRGYLNGVCSPKNSCTLLEWQTTNISLKLAHEIGHSLGMSHDGVPPNRCRGDTHIMAAKYSRKKPAKTWSPCSKHELQRFLMSRYSWCLR